MEITLKCDESQYPGNTGSGVTERYEPKNSAYVRFWRITVFYSFFWQVIQVQSRCCSVSNFFKARFKYRMFHEHNLIQIRRTSFNKKYSCLIGRWSNNSHLIRFSINVKIPEHAITLNLCIKIGTWKDGHPKIPCPNIGDNSGWVVLTRNIWSFWYF